LKIAPLLAFPFLQDAEAKLYRVSAGASLSSSQIELYFKIEAETELAFSAIALPAQNETPLRKDELWKTTCFECFLPGKGISNYLEFNGSPSGDWNWYSFQDYRQGMKPVPVANAREPKMISMKKSARTLDVTWVLPITGDLPVQDFDPMGLTVVLHTTAATLYFAFIHAGEKPDFHTRASFKYDPVRN
jgi:hypothetical protein